MRPTIGFALLTHQNSDQTVALIRVLNDMFGSPPIALHNDFIKCPIDTTLLPPNVRIVRPFCLTSWGRLSLVDAAIRTIRELYKEPGSPDWFYLLSNACLPIKSSERILADLQRSTADVHIAHERIAYNSYQRDWQETCFNRYVAYTPKMAKRIPSKTARKWLTLKRPMFTNLFTPFSPSFSCFAGEFWITANRKAATYLLNFHDTRPELWTHLVSQERFRLVIPDECYFQSVFCNSAELTISADNFRFIDWISGPYYPKLLTMDDFERLEESPSHFARKFDARIDGEVVERVKTSLVFG